MALIECVECGGKVSDRAKACPHCGCPMEDFTGATEGEDLALDAMGGDTVKMRVPGSSGGTAVEDGPSETSATAKTVNLRMKSVSPLRTPDGEKMGLVYEGDLLGVCPSCKTETTFKPAPQGEKPATAGEGEEKKAAAKKGGFFSSAFKDISKAFKGGKATLDFKCQGCGTIFQICPECQRPNRYNQERDQCDFCEQLLLT